MFPYVEPDSFASLTSVCLQDNLALLTGPLLPKLLCTDSMSNCQGRAGKGKSGTIGLPFYKWSHNQMNMQVSCFTGHMSGALPKAEPRLPHAGFVACLRSQVLSTPSLHKGHLEGHW